MSENLDVLIRNLAKHGQLTNCTHVAAICPETIAQKHDGKLDTYNHADKPHIQELHATVGLEPAEISWTNKHLVAVHGGYGDYESNLVYLDPQQALSLLTWLQQEERALVKLVVEEQSCAEI